MIALKNAPVRSSMPTLKQSDKVPDYGATLEAFDAYVLLPMASE